VATRVDGTLYYVHQDHLGSTVALSDAAGGEVGRVQYDPYGEVLTSTLPVTLTDRLFTGQRLDSSSGLYYYNARYYDPHLGRFVSADTLVPEAGNPQDLNRYAYVRDNPLRYTDPSGYCIPGVNCPGDVSGIEPPPDPSGLRGETYAAWLTHYILWQEQQRAETGGTLDIELGQQAAAFELSGFLMKDPELLGDILYRQVAEAAPQFIAQAAGAATDVLISGAGWALGMVLEGWQGQSRLGDLTASEIAQIQAVVDQADQSLWVVGSAARGRRGPTSDIDYYFDYSSDYPRFDTRKLPGLDWHGILGWHVKVRIGPGILFQPGQPPEFHP